MANKIEPPRFSPGSSARPALVDRVPVDARYVLIVGPPGYGKTVLAHEIHAACPPGTAAWLSVDLLDRQPYAFWSHLIAALERTTAEIDDEPLDLLAERPTSDLTFLASLCAQIRASPDRLVLVLDDVDKVDHPDVLRGLEQLGEWCDDRLRLVLTGRVDPDLPLAKWRARGSLVAFRQADLRFDRDASQRFVATVAPGLLTVEDVDVLHDRVEGWPMALQVAVLVARDADDPHRAAREMAAADRLFADYLTGEVLDALSGPERDVALGLSVLEWFDHELCQEVLGRSSIPVVRQLRDRQIPMVELAGRDGFRFHGLVRELLDSELRWRDPERHVELHRRAGEALLRRDDRPAAVRHFLAADDPDRASDVLAAPALALVDAGRYDELRSALVQLPADVQITGAERMIDLALAQVLTGRWPEFEQAARRAHEITPVDDDRLQSRLRLLAIVERALRGYAGDVRRLVELEDQHTVTSDAGWYWEPRREAIVVRFAYALELSDVDDRLDALRRSPAPEAVLRVLVPSVESIVALRRGDLAAALRRQQAASEALRHIPSDSHPASFEAFLAAGWCAWATGSFDQVRDLSDRLFAHPFATYPAFQVHVVALTTERLVRTGAAGSAIELLGHVDPDLLAGEFVRTAHALAGARALHGAGRHGEMEELLAKVPSSPARDLLLAWSAARLGRYDEAQRLVSERDRWPTHQRIEAMLVMSLLGDGARQDRSVMAAVHEAARDGWVAPLLGHGPEIDDMVRPLAPAIHPALAAALTAAPDEPSRTGRARRAPNGIPVELTDREMALLALLPTHLSYSQMGEQLYVSVNTIKTNLKSIYRKLSASSRDEAVRSARVVGLLDDVGP